MVGGVRTVDLSNVEWWGRELRDSRFLYINVPREYSRLTKSQDATLWALEKAGLIHDTRYPYPPIVTTAIAISSPTAARAIAAATPSIAINAHAVSAVTTMATTDSTVAPTNAAATAAGYPAASQILARLLAGVKQMGRMVMGHKSQIDIEKGEVAEKGEATEKGEVAEKGEVLNEKSPLLSVL